MFEYSMMIVQSGEDMKDVTHTNKSKLAVNQVYGLYVLFGHLRDISV